MAEGRSRVAWSHTAEILALVANVNRDPKKTRPFKSSQFNPHTAARRHRESVSVEQLTRDVLRVAESKQGRGQSTRRPVRAPGSPSLTPEPPGPLH